MKGPSLYGSSPLKQDSKGNMKQQVTKGKLNKKDDTRADAYPGPKKDKKKPTVKKSFSNPDGSVNIPVNPNTPNVKVPKNNASVKGKTGFEVDTQGITNVIGKLINNRKKNIKRVKKTVSKVKDYFTKR